jgi:hypothetical protein
LETSLVIRATDEPTAALLAMEKGIEVTTCQRL